MKTLIAITLLTATLAHAVPQYLYKATTLGQYEETKPELYGIPPLDCLAMSPTRITVPYAKVSTNEVENFETGILETVISTNYPALPINLCRWTQGDLLPRKATPAELDEVATATATAEALAETTRQEAKSASLKAVENNFLALCDSLTSTTSHTKLTFAQIASIGDAMTDQALHISIAIQLLSIDAEGKTIGGLRWWYDCAWHPEIIEAE